MLAYHIGQVDYFDASNPVNLSEVLTYLCEEFHYEDVPLGTDLSKQGRVLRIV
jgi:hypothetical protein